MNPIYLVDAFTNEAFRGNPAGVCLLKADAEESWMQKVAAEMNLPDTAFLAPAENGWHLRWFTPKREVVLCGHATLAAAHVLWQTSRLPHEEAVRFHTQSGQLTCERRADGRIAMDFPAEPVQPALAPAALIEGLGLIPRYTGRNRMDMLVETDSEEAVRDLQPDMALLKNLDCRGVIVTSKSYASEYDFVSRFFSPANGIDEDPVTGSAHCALAPYWSKRLRKEALTGYQASKRGGMVETQIAGDRVYLTGRAVTILQGRLEV